MAWSVFFCGKGTCFCHQGCPSPEQMTIWVNKISTVICSWMQFFVGQPLEHQGLYTITRMYINVSHSARQQPKQGLLLSNPHLPTQTPHHWQQRDTPCPDLGLATCQNSFMIKLFWSALSTFMLHQEKKNEKLSQFGKKKGKSYMESDSWYITSER